MNFFFYNQSQRKFLFEYQRQSSFCAGLMKSILILQMWTDNIDLMDITKRGGASVGAGPKVREVFQVKLFSNVKVYPLTKL
jgi:hypothetical protein